MSEEADFPRLRPEVTLAPFSTSARKGTSLLLLPDGRSLEASARLVDLIRLLDGKHDLKQIATELSGRWRVRVTAGEVRSWTDQVLAPYDLLVRAEPGPNPARGLPPRGARKPGRLLIPARFLLPLTNRLRLLFLPAPALVLLWSLALCHYGFYAEFFSHPLPAPPTSSGRLAALLFLLGSVIFHELGHLAACRTFGCPHGEIRLGLYLLFPVFYADVTPSWRLSRKERMIVDLGGVYFQALLLLPLFLLSRTSGDSLWRILFIEVDLLIAFSLNPFLRFDGYWVCSDLLGIPNLQARSRALLKGLGTRILSRGPRPPPSPLLEVRSPEKLGLILFTVGRTLFLLSIPLLLTVHLARHLPEWTGLAARTADSALQEAARGNAVGSFTHLSRLLLFVLLLANAGRVLGKLAGTSARAWRVLRRAAPRGKRCVGARPALSGPTGTDRSDPGRSSPESRKPRSYPGPPVRRRP